MEQYLRTLLQKMGERIDHLFGRRGSGATLESVIPALYDAIESQLAHDRHGLRRVAPNRIRVILSYEIQSHIEPEMLEDLKRELTDTTRSYIQDHRYALDSKVDIEITSDPYLQKPFEVQAKHGTKPTEPGRRLLGRDGMEIPIRFGEGVGPHRLMLGRTGGNDIVVDDPTVSRFHAALTLNPDGDIVISDLSSANGTFINGRRIESATVLCAGDELTIGHVPFRLKDG